MMAMVRNIKVPYKIIEFYSSSVKWHYSIKKRFLDIENIMTKKGVPANCVPYYLYREKMRERKFMGRLYYHIKESVIVLYFSLSLLCVCESKTVIKSNNAIIVFPLYVIKYMLNV